SHPCAIIPPAKIGAVPQENKAANFCPESGICCVIGLCVPPRSAAALCLAAAAFRRFCDASQFLRNLCFLVSPAPYRVDFSGCFARRPFRHTTAPAVVWLLFCPP